MSRQYGVIDLFAGPGGLAEGFSKVRDTKGDHPFRIALSIEMEASAHRTLLLRSFLRQFDEIPNQYIDALNSGKHPTEWKEWAHEQGFAAEWAEAEREALRLTLADDAGETAATIDPIIDRIRDSYHGDTILVGGPPCQAYSLVGRSRNRGKADYIAENDHRHYLYKEYIRILDRLRPAAFVMENVKGILSSRLEGNLVFNMIRQDLEGIGGAEAGGYRLITVVAPDASLIPHTPSTYAPANRDFIVRTEQFGIPQARHRVIVIGLRADIAGDHVSLGLTPSTQRIDVRNVLGNMPKVRSGINREPNSDSDWRLLIDEQFGWLSQIVSDNATKLALSEARIRFSQQPLLQQRTDSIQTPPYIANAALDQWIRNPDLVAVANHEARGHMRKDLMRYLFVATFAEVHGQSPKTEAFPEALAPAHANWNSGKFVDRFRAQRWGAPSTTVTSHISKDGHYFIHPDPLQCRSLTVREAARLQTFPDDYLFLGNRTHQYVQAGNAVPPYLANLMAAALAKVLMNTHISSRQL